MKKTLLLLSSLFAMPAMASTLLVDFGNNGTNGSQTTSPDTNGNHWNNSFSGGYSVTDMVTTTNVGTTIDLTYTTVPGANTNALGVTGAPSPFNISTAYEDAIFTTGSSLGAGTTIRLSQLDATKTYMFTLFGSRDTTTSRTTAYQVAGATTTSGSLQTSGIDLGGAGINHNIANVLVLGGSGGIAPNGSNQIDVTFFAQSGGFGYLNAMQITVIPEPASALLGAIGMLILMRRRR